MKRIKLSEAAIVAGGWTNQPPTAESLGLDPNAAPVAEPIPPDMAPICDPVLPLTQLTAK
jgi:hypothetical protein